MPSLCLCLQLGESLEEQLGQRLLRMPPPPQLPPRVRQGQQHLLEQQQQPAVFQLPQDALPAVGDAMQVGAALRLLCFYQGTVCNRQPSSGRPL
jgi:hypothetical protein